MMSEYGLEVFPLIFEQISSWLCKMSGQFLRWCYYKPPKDEMAGMEKENEIFE